jgi:hypothetical protein
VTLNAAIRCCADFVVRLTAAQRARGVGVAMICGLSPSEAFARALRGPELIHIDST